jgi:uroporphyrin-3 C-methyltransferase
MSDQQLSDTNDSPSDSLQQSPSDSSVRSDTVKHRNTESRKATPKKGGNGGLWFFTLLNILLILAAAGAGYWFFEQHRTQVTEQDRLQNQQLGSLVSQLNNNQISIEQVNESANKLTENMQKLQPLVDATLLMAESNQQAVLQVSGRRPADWLLAEADYLVRMAGRKLWLEHDVSTAIMLLESADSRLNDLKDPSLIPIRELLMTDIQTLNTINPIDLAGIALTVGGMLAQVETMPIALPSIPDVSDQDKGLSEDVSQWRENLHKVWRFFREDLVRYTPNTKSIRPLLTERQQWLIAENLKHSLQQAKTAVLAEDASLFKQSVQTALRDIDAHYDNQQIQVSQFSESLQDLLKTQLNRDYPEQLSAALPLQDLLQARLTGQYHNKVEAQ